ncbi:MAG: hypothetical protein HC836_23225 [Richelia sp. RM2_1_2]|nr:hypothetical protein [Richelia sp. RM2_1_2]
MASRHSRQEAFAKIRSTLPDRPFGFPQQVSIIDEANYQDNRNVLQLRGIEAGPGITLTIADADNTKFKTRETKLIISAAGGTTPGVDDITIAVVPLAGIVPPGPGVSTVIIGSLPIALGDQVYAVTVNGLDISPLDWSFTMPSTLNIGPLNYNIQNTDEIVIFIKS